MPSLGCMAVCMQRISRCSHDGARFGTIYLHLSAYTWLPELWHGPCTNRLHGAPSVTTMQPSQPHSAVCQAREWSTSTCLQATTAPCVRTCRLLLDRRHRSVALVSQTGTVLGGITYRVFGQQVRQAPPARTAGIVVPSTLETVEPRRCSRQGACHLRAGSAGVAPHWTMLCSCAASEWCAGLGQVGCGVMHMYNDWGVHLQAPPCTRFRQSHPAVLITCCAGVVMRCSTGPG